MPSKRHLRNNLMSLISITNPLANPNICVIQLFFSSLIVLTINYHLLTDHHCQWGANSHLYSWVCLLWKVQLIILAYQNLENIASSNQQVGFIWIYNYVPLHMLDCSCEELIWKTNHRFCVPLRLFYWSGQLLRESSLITHIRVSHFAKILMRNIALFLALRLNLCSVSPDTTSHRLNVRKAKPISEPPLIL